MKFIRDKRDDRLIQLGDILPNLDHNTQYLNVSSIRFSNEQLRLYAKTMRCEVSDLEVVNPFTHVTMVGNLSEGYYVTGPYLSFDEACEEHEGRESWIMTIEKEGFNAGL